jgi:hypothetical protein
MPRHRIAFHFVDEEPRDRAIWEAWLGSAPAAVRRTASLGERRPWVELAAPFRGRHAAETRRADELAGLDVATTLVGALGTLARLVSRSIALLLSGQPFGRVLPTGADAAVAARMAEWRQLIEIRPPDPVAWQREGWLSLWAGTLPAPECDRLLEERYGTDGAISPFARALGIKFYDHDFLERIRSPAPVLLEALLAQLSFAESFAASLPTELCTRTVDTLIALYGADLACRPRDVARRRLRFLGSYPYRPP